MKLNPGTILAGRYEIVDKLGTGGMAVVYRGRDLKLDRYVTVKVMREEYALDEEFIARFNVEARAAASLSNQNIVNVYDVGQEGETHYIVMEYIDGVTLKELIRRRAPFDDEEVLGVAVQIATGLQHAHQNGIVHRDIKPQNIMVTAKGVVKVTDFGIARAATAATTNTGSTMGSVHYFSPEQARGGYVDHKSDIYSLGIVMYEMATGQLPYDGESAVTIALKHINESLPDMRKINPNISDNTARIIMKATEKLSSRRYQSIEEMITDMKRSLTVSTGEYDSWGSLESNPTINLTEEDMAAIIKEVRPIYYDEEGEDEDYDDGYEEKDYDYAADYAADKATERKIVIAAVLTGIALVALISSIVLYYFNRSKPTAAVVVVPDFSGMTVDEAYRKVNGKLNITETESIYDDQAPEGTIVSQDISVDEELAEGDTVMVVTSMGSNKVTVPNIKNQRISDVERMEQFASKELVLHEEQVFDEHIPQTIVVSQEPAEGEKVEPGSVVTAYVSLGQEPKQIKVPDLSNMTEAQAITILQSNDLVVGLSTKQESTTVPEGQIITQTIAPGTEVGKGTTIGFVVSKGAPEATPTPEPRAEEVTKTLTVDPYVPEGIESLHLQIIKISSGLAETFFDNEVNVSQFPMHFQVTGVGEAEFQVYFVDAAGELLLQGNQTISFSEGNAND